MKPVFPRYSMRIAALCAVALLASCASTDKAEMSQGPLGCDMQGIGQLKIDGQTQIVAVHNFKLGDDIRLRIRARPS